MARLRQMFAGKRRTMALVSLGTLPLFYTATAAVVFVRGIASPVPSSIANTPVSLGLKYEDVTFPSRVDKLKLRGWYIPGGDQGTVIMVHGGKGNRANEPILELAGDLAKRGFNILMFDRRDCGESERSNRKDRPHMERDVAGAFDFVRARGGADENIFIYGTSMGALAAIAFAAEGPNLQGIVLDSCFANTPETLRRVLAAKGLVPSILLPGMLLTGRALYGIRKFSAIDFIGSVSARILFIAGDRDDTAPVGDAYKLLGASKNPSNQVWVIKGGGHSSGYNNDPRQYADKIAAFFRTEVV